MQLRLIHDMKLENNKKKHLKAWMFSVCSTFEHCEMDFGPVQISYDYWQRYFTYYTYKTVRIWHMKKIWMFFFFAFLVSDKKRSERR